MTPLSQLCREVFPGQADDVDFFAGRLVRARCPKFTCQFRAWAPTRPKGVSDVCMRSRARQVSAKYRSTRRMNPATCLLRPRTSLAPGALVLAISLPDAWFHVW